jgi:hypothetical protein
MSMSRITPPRVWADLNRMPTGVGCSTVRPETLMSWKPPEVSLPKVMPAEASRITQSRIVTL